MNTLLSDVKKISIEGFLGKHGFAPSSVKGYNLWYLSPLHEEKTPSFKVNNQLNTWYDFGIGKGGTILDLVMHMQGIELMDAKNYLIGDMNILPTQNHIAPINKATTPLSDHKIKINNVQRIESKALWAYSYSRGIKPEIVKKYCKEVHYNIGEKSFFALGFKNDSGGYVLRNKYSKCCSSPADLSTILSGGESQAKNIFICEGMMDFLSIISDKEMLANHLPASVANEDTDFIILNSLAFKDKCIDALSKKNYTTIILGLDNDQAGKQCTAEFMKIFPNSIDISGAYSAHKDINDVLQLKYTKAQQDKEKQAKNTIKFSDKEKTLKWLTQQQSNSAEVANSLKGIISATKVIQNFVLKSRNL